MTEGRRLSEALPAINYCKPSNPFESIIMNTLEAAGKPLRWLWMGGRGDPWSNVPLGHKPGTDHLQLDHLAWARVYED